MMSWKKIFCGALAASMIFSASVFAAPEDSANAKLAKIETDTYGMEQSGAFLDRISRLEKNYSGQNMNGNMNARIEALYNALYNNDTSAGILAKINALEWNIDHEVQSGGVDKRLTALENKILGKSGDGTFNERIRALAKASYGEEILPITTISIPADTLIKVATTVPVGSKTLQEGDTIPIRVVDDVFVNDGLVFASGLTGEGTVMNVRRAKNIFSNGKIEADFHTLKAIDGQDVKIYAGVEATEAMNKEEMARGLSLLGQTFSGKNKDRDTVLVHGKNIDLPAGVELYVQIKNPVVVQGVKSTGSGLAITETVTPAPTNQNESVLLPDEMDMPTPTDEPTIPANEPPVNEPTTPTSEVNTPAPPAEPATPSESELSPDEMNATPPPPAPEPPPSNEQPIVKEEPTPNVEPRPDEGKTLDGQDGEIIEIIDED